LPVRLEQDRRQSPATVILAKAVSETQGGYMKRIYSRGLCAVAAAALAVLLGVNGSLAQPVVKVGSKNYTESIVIADMMADLLEAHGIKVERKLGLGGTAVIHQALLNGEIDMYPEYTGTALLVQLKLPVSNDPDLVYRTVKDEYAKRFNVVWLKPIGFNDTYALAMRQADATKLGIKTLSDLAHHSGELTLGSTQEFLVRPDALPGLQKTYGLKFKATRGMDPGLVYQALTTKNVDVISVFTTDGRIKALHLAVLRDDKKFFPPYYLTPIVRKAALDANPKIEAILDSLSGKISEAQMAAINSAVDQDKRPAAEVAREFLRKEKLIP
jgi:glycine betaine/choline ABC-type transport system substrate-binding protein